MTISFLQAWYVDQCDGDWEHRYGVTLGTLDNPGWSLAVDLIGTELEGRVLPRTRRDRSDNDWLQVWSDGKRFEVACGAANLIEALDEFQGFAS